jgi:hypothetical protein
MTRSRTREPGVTVLIGTPGCHRRREKRHREVKCGERRGVESKQGKEREREYVQESLPKEVPEGLPMGQGAAWHVRGSGKPSGLRMRNGSGVCTGRLSGGGRVPGTCPEGLLAGKAKRGSAGCKEAVRVGEG